MHDHSITLSVLTATVFAAAPLAAQDELLRTKHPGSTVTGAIVHDSTRNRLVVVQPTATAMELFEWDGTSWQHILTNQSPPPRNSASWVFDPARSRCVLFGGHWWSTNVRDDVWEWDGRAWHSFDPAIRPGPAADVAATYDAALGEAVFFGGKRFDTTQNADIQLNEFWSWNGSRWQQHGAASAGPAPRSLAALVHDSLAGETILFGGYIGNNAFSNETWAWRPSSGWQQLTTNGSPSPRGWHDMAFDPTRGRALLAGQYLLWNNDETWEWHGPTRTWTQVSSSPPAGIRRDRPEVVWDGQDVLLFGGVGNFGSGASDRYAALSDLHAWNPSAASWTARQTSMPPASRWMMATDSQRGRLVAVPANHFSMVLWERSGGSWTPQAALGQPLPLPSWGPGLADTYRGSVLLFGGYNYNQQYLDQTWSWNGTSWSQLPTGPSSRRDVAMAGTPWNGGTVWMFGGLESETPLVTSSQLWAHDGVGWSQVTPTTPWPPALHHAAMCYDQGRNRLVMYGGQTGGPGTDTDQTWEWDGTRWWQVSPLHRPPTASGHRLVYDAVNSRVIALHWYGAAWS
ncbi:MAG: hypothetical protein KDC98_15975, partial [Planctomycetes bacterium]|nr:hypothetical protein [Planctomycetota bacterium]